MDQSNQSDSITFSINQVAKMLGVVPGTIRNWEKNGLINVKRSASNYRIFTFDDISFLKKVKEYSVDKHMGTHAIKMLLSSACDSDLENAVEQSKQSNYSKKLISAKWREIRKQQGYTLEEVSQATGISVAHLSKLENGGNVSLDVLNNLAHFYHESPLYFLEPSQEETHLVRKGSGEPIQLNEDSGINWYSLIALRDHVMYPVLCTVEPGSGSLQPHVHNGEEFVYVFSGVLEFTLNSDPPAILHPGDSFYYRGSDLHTWRNISPKPAKLLWVHSSVSK